jgi:hypothetical protein
MNSFVDFLKDNIILKFLLALLLFLYSIIAGAQIDKNSELFKTLKSKDSILFESAFNSCQTERLKTMVSEEFEFYHDIGGIQDKEGFIAAIQKNICANPGIFTRKLVPKSLEIFELKNNGKLYGAIQRGKHDFYITENQKTKQTGRARFTHIWILENKNWILKRVLSFDHKPASN